MGMRTPFDRATMVSFRVAHIFDALKARISPDAAPRPLGPSQVALRDLERYYAWMPQQLRRIQSIFSGANAKLAEGCCKALKDRRVDPDALEAIWGIISYEFHQHADQYGLGTDAGSRQLVDQFLDYLSDLSPAAMIALLDASERAWLLPEEMPWPERVRAVGLVR